MDLRPPADGVHRHPHDLRGDRSDRPRTQRAAHSADEWSECHPWGGHHRCHHCDGTSSIRQYPRADTRIPGRGAGDPQCGGRFRCHRPDAGNV